MSEIVIGQLRCEYQVNPMGLDERRPRLAWLLTAPAKRRGVTQSAYQVLVASSEEKLVAGKGDLWDSGKVVRDRSSQVEYAGKAVGLGRRAWWTVRAWDETGEPTPWAPPAFWETGLLSPADWKAKWIGSSIAADPSESSPCPHLRKAFTLRGPVARARLYASALGLYEMWINGQRVGDRYFTPGWTDYAVRVQYQVYDVTALLAAGDNAIGGILGDGWYCGYLIWDKHRNTYGSEKQLLAQLVVDYADGTSETIGTDATWTCSAGPILASDIYNGETYDARAELPLWSQAGFADAGWTSVKLLAAPAAKLVASAAPPVRKIDEIQPRKITEPTPGAFVFDLAQNMVGWVRLKVPAGTPRGTKIVLRHAEFLNPDGTMYTTNLRLAQCTDTYIVKGAEAETFEPRFTFHGFQYVELTGLAAAPALDAVTGIVVHSDTPPTGSFECSNAMLNQLQHNIVWGQKGNFLEVPTDCPQRNERLGWTGDAQVFIRTACFNMDVAGFFNKWLVDLTDAQSPSGTFPMVAPDVLAKKQGDGGAGWADAAIICPWTIYLAYGDTRVLERHYKAMAKYIDFLGSADFSKRHCFGDWLSQNDWTPNDLIATAYWAYCTGIMIQVADILGLKAQKAKYVAVLKSIRRKSNDEFVTPAGRLVSFSQTGYVLALHFGLLSERLRPVVAERLVRRIGEFKDHLSTGFLGTPYLLSALADNGKLDLAYKLLLNEDFPSWGYPITHGATTMWERWDGWRHDNGFQDAGMNSFNHYAYGAVGDWMYRNIGGIDIDPAQPAYRHIIVRPRIGGGLTHARAAIDSIHGRVETHWRLAGKNFTLAVTVPPNCTATVYMPTAGAVTESRRPAAKSPGVKLVGKKDGVTAYRVGSGTYEFKAKAGVCD